MNPRHLLLAAAMLAAGLPAQAALNSAQRLAKLAQLPDWTGIWQVEGSTTTLDPAGPPPYNAAWSAKYAKARAEAPKLVDTYDRVCAAGVPRLMGSPEYFEAIVTPEETTMVFSQREVRHIYTDGSPHTEADELWPMYWGDSIGHWEGNTLVIDTISILGKEWLDPTAATLSDNAHIIEHVRMTDPNHLQDQITVEDPTSLAKPWRFTRTYRRSSEINMTDTPCNWEIGAATKMGK